MGGQVGCERRIEVFVKIQNIFFFGEGGGVGSCHVVGGGEGCQGGCERRNEVFVKIQKKKKKKKLGGGGGGRVGRGGVRVDVKKEIKFLWGWGGRSSRGGGGGQGGCK